MLKLILVVSTLVVGALASHPLDREKRYAPYPYTGVFTGGFPFGGGAYAGAGGAFAGAGAPFWGGWNYPQQRNPWVPFPWVPFPVFPFAQNWYDGENVCKEVRTQNSDADQFGEWLKDVQTPNFQSDFSHEQETCQGSNTQYVCFKRIYDSTGNRIQATKYACCHGFVRNSNGPGCVEKTPLPPPPPPKPSAPANPNDKLWYNISPNEKYTKNGAKSSADAKIDLKDIVPTLRGMGATEFVSMADEASMTETLHTGNYTIFCPINSALEAFIEDEHSADMDNEVEDPPKDRRLEKKLLLHNLLTDHMVSGFHKLDDFRDKQVIEAAHQDSQIRMSIYYVPEKVVTANCVPVVSGDHFARNGIIHVVTRVLPAPSRSVADVIAGDAQFSVLKGMLSRAGLVQTLRDPNGTFTLFAPTDHALSSSRHAAASNRCTASAMRHHVIDHVICSSAIPQFAKSLNLIGELLSLSRDANYKLYVDDVQIVVRDIMATNGVVHVIDGVLSTRQAKSASQIMDEYGLREFLSLVEAANLKSLYDSLENVTFFIPSDEAIQSVPPGLLDSLMSNVDSLFSILLYHVVEGEAELTASEQILESKLENTSVRVQAHAAYPHATQQILVQCATVLSAGNKMCGGTLHVINKLLLPPKLSILSVLSSLEGFSTLVHLLRSTGLDRRLDSRELGTYTLLAPTDDALHNAGGGLMLRRLHGDRPLAADILRMHIVAGTMCCAQLRSDLQSGRPEVRAIDGSILTLGREGGVLAIGGARIVDCDIVATNGVIHMLDSLVRQEDVVIRTAGVGLTRI